jgi:polygalacturonase
LTSRRSFLRSLVGSSALLLGTDAPWLARGATPRLEARPSADPWPELPVILARIQPPRFPDREWNVVKFGAVGDGRTDCSSAFRGAIAACHTAGGGRVLVSAGEYVTGAIRLLSGVNLEVGKGATIRFSRDPRAYPNVLTRWEGVELLNFSPFIYAFRQENIAVTGEGTLDGNADCTHWWPWKGQAKCGWKAGDPGQSKDRNLLFSFGEQQTAVEQRVFGEGHYLRPQFIQPYQCKNVLIEGLTLLNSPMWQVTPAVCTNVIVRNLTIDSSGPNTDGCDPDSCRDVLIENCVFNTGDDCIAIKSGRNGDGRRRHTPSENIVIRGCRMKNGHGGVTIGSEISGGVRNVFVENCHMDSPHLDSAIRIKSNAMRGGTIENIFVRNVDVGEVAVAGLSIDFRYEEGAAGNFTPVVRDVELRNVNVHDTKYAVFLRGLPNAPIRNVRMTDCVFENAAQSSIVENALEISLENVRINGKTVEKFGV